MTANPAGNFGTQEPQYLYVTPGSGGSATPFYVQVQVNNQGNGPQVPQNVVHQETVVSSLSPQGQYMQPVGMVGGASLMLPTVPATNQQPPPTQQHYEYVQYEQHYHQPQMDQMQLVSGPPRHMGPVPMGYNNMMVNYGQFQAPPQQQQRLYHLPVGEHGDPEGDLDRFTSRQELTRTKAPPPPAREEKPTVPPPESFEAENARSIERQQKLIHQGLKLKTVPPTVQMTGPKEKEEEKSKPVKSRGAVAKQNQEEQEQKREALSNAAAKSTEAAKKRLLTPDGWDQLYTWLKSAQKKEAWNNLQTLLMQCLDLPVTVQLLRRNDTAKLIKRLSKDCPNSDVKNLCVDIISVWTDAVKIDEKQSDAKASKSRISPNPSSVDQNLERSSSEEADASSSAGVNSGKVDSNKDSSVKVSSHSHQTQSTAKKSPAREAGLFEKMLHSGDAPEAPKGGSKVGGGATTPPSGATAKPKKRTAKTAPTKFRSTGLEEGSEDAPAQKKQKAEPAAKTKPVFPFQKRTVASAQPSASTSEVKDGKVVSGDSLANYPPAPIPSLEQKPKPKPEPPKPAKKLIETNDFMNALAENAKKPGVIRRKKKEIPKLPPVGTPSTVAPAGAGTSAISPPGTGASIKPEFYRDVLIGGNSARPSTESPPSQSPKIQPSASTGSLTSLAQQSKAPSSGKKRVRFVDTEKVGELVEIKFFEVDDSERVNVNKVGTTDMKHLEMQREKISLQQAKQAKTNHAFMVQKDFAQEEEDYIPWKLIPFECADDLIGENSGANSKEKLVESERQKHVLEAIFLTKIMVPDAPQEADPSERTSAKKEDPLEIPLEDVTTGDNVSGTDQTLGTVQADQSNLPPELASLMANLNKTGMLPSVQGSPSQTGPAAALMANVMQTIQGGTSVVQNNPMAAMGMVPNFNPMMMMPPGPINVNLMNQQRFPGAMMGNPRMPGQGGIRVGPIRPMGASRPLRPGGPMGNQAPRPPFRKRCPFYAKGRCTYGDSCRFDHGDQKSDIVQPNSADNRGTSDRDYRASRDRDYRVGNYRSQRGTDVDYRSRNNDRDYRSRRNGGYHRNSDTRHRRRSRSPKRSRSRSRSKSSSRSRSRSPRRSRSRSNSKSRSRSRSRSGSRSRSRSDSKSPRSPSGSKSPERIAEKEKGHENNSVADDSTKEVEK